MMELIDREKLIESIKNREYCNECIFSNDCYKSTDVITCEKLVINLINDQPTVNTWISVEDRLPKIEEEVLVLTDSGRLLGNLEKSGIWWFDEWSTTLENPNEGIIAWMPIPEYKEQEDD